ncbi:C-type lectin domain family 4 member D-like isoform X2 [Pyrgilauda ruficollis]|uniref:C-type lectin domain family 4 member D-like isoform X2 n=1 Tax=Pyrgilauda ruficollis TaxID=221976 RepID=UPI001B8622F9|nr:C-type lectin domain family 4 member D-like isoform X2 [Pyrgilauda ruficollis]
MMNGQGRVSPGSAAPAEERNCTWLNIWVFLIFALAIKAAVVTIWLVALLDGSSGRYKILLQNSTEWYCVPSSSAEKVDGWMCCPKGWRRFQGSCYFLSPDTMSWPESAQNCSGMGSQLVVVNSKAEQEFLFNLAKEKATRIYETKFYIGLAAYKNGKWQWVDQTPYENTATLLDNLPFPGNASADHEHFSTISCSQQVTCTLSVSL